MARQGEPPAAPTGARTGYQGRERAPAAAPRRSKAAARVETPKRLPAQPGATPTQPRRLPAPISQHDHRPAAGHRRPEQAQPTPPCTAPSRLGTRGQDDPGHRDRTTARATLTAKTTPRWPKVVASRAHARCVPCHQLTTPPSRGAKQGSTAAPGAGSPVCAGHHRTTHAAVVVLLALGAGSPWPARDGPPSGHTSAPAPCQRSTAPTPWLGAGSHGIEAA